jgi:hypothetical protein
MMEAKLFQRLETFTAGMEILTPVMEQHGFVFEGESTRRNPSIVGRGEEVAFGDFVRAERRLIVELSYSVGPVKYLRKILEVARRKTSNP